MGSNRSCSLLVFLLLLLCSCGIDQKNFELILEAQGDENRYRQISKIGYTLDYLKYTSSHQIIDSLNLKVDLQKNQISATFPCAPDSLFTSSTYALFPFSHLKDTPTITFNRRDTLNNQVYHLYDVSYPCKDHVMIEHQIYSSYLNNQIRSHFFKINEEYFWIDVITWQKEGGLLFPLRNKIYTSNQDGQKKFLYADLVYSGVFLE